MNLIKQKKDPQLGDTWVLEGAEHIMVMNRGACCGGQDWVAINTETGKDMVRPFGWTQEQLLFQLQEKVAGIVA